MTIAHHRRVPETLTMTTELILVAALMAGFVGSSHCAGMCGPIAVLFEGKVAADSRFSGIARRILYNVGRGMFYVSLGTVAGFSGQVLAGALDLQGAAGLLRLVAAVMVVLVGLQLMGFTQALRFIEAKGARVWQWMSPLARRLLPISTPSRALGAGFVWGALPCGLVYSAAALAVSSGTALAGALTMAAFWLGTLPTLLVIGATAHRLRRWQNQPRYRPAAGLVLVIGALVAIAIPWLIGAHEHSVHGLH